MYLLSASEIASILSSPMQNGSCAVPDIVRFNSVLARVLTRVEEAMNVHSLTRASWIDEFKIAPAYDYQEVGLRLSNAFINPDVEPVITTKSGDPVEAELDVDERMGVIHVTLPSGSYKVAYSAGFVAELGTNVFQGVPEWVKSIAATILIHWSRLTYGAGSLKDVAYDALTAAMIREIQTRVYERYMRPRAGVIWPSRDVRYGA